MDKPFQFLLLIFLKQ